MAQLAALAGEQPRHVGPNMDGIKRNTLSLPSPTSAAADAGEVNDASIAAVPPSKPSRLDGVGERDSLLSSVAKQRNLIALELFGTHLCLEMRGFAERNIAPLPTLGVALEFSVSIGEMYYRAIVNEDSKARKTRSMKPRWNFCAIEARSETPRTPHSPRPNGTYKQQKHHEHNDLTWPSKARPQRVQAESRIGL